MMVQIRPRVMLVDVPRARQCTRHSESGIELYMGGRRKDANSPK